MSIISRTTFTFTVLHRTDQPLDGLEAAIYEADQGNAVGMEEILNQVEVPDDQVPMALRRMGNDGEFFDDDLDAEDDS